MEIFIIECIYIRHAFDRLELERLDTGCYKTLDDAKKALDELYKETKADIDEDLEEDDKSSVSFHIKFYDDCCGDNNIYDATISNFKI